MSRPLRIEYPGAIYDIMNRGWNRCPIFQDAGDRFLLLKTISQAIHTFKLDLHAYSLMPNHYHLLLETPCANLSRAMQHIDGVYTQRFNRKYQREGSLFRGRFKSILVQKESYFLELVRYIHQNGTKANLASCPEKDPFSSHKDYLYPHLTPPWLTTNTTLSMLSPDPALARNLLNDFVNRKETTEIEIVMSRPRWPALLGNKDFKTWVRTNFIETQKKPIDVPQDRLARQKLSPDDVLAEISLHYQQSKESICFQSSSKRNEARRVAMILLREYSLLTYSEIGAILGGVTYGAVSVALKQSNISSVLFQQTKASLDQHFKYQL